MTGAHRKDIDGLRAVAVLAVMFFHAGWQTFSGGFVGVDVFFVISGYLITRIIAAEIAEGRFSLARFYARRVRRIVPALTAILLTTTVLAFLVLTPGQLRGFGTAAISTALMVANVQYFLQSGYFADSSDRLPLLHTWSLSVEEQFYLLWPPFLAAVAIRRPRYTGKACVVLLAASLCISHRAAGAAPEAGFYLLSSRAWELLLGALAAIGVLPVPRSAAVASIASWIGIVAVTLACTAFSAATPFPGVAALLPTVGALLILVGGSEHAPLVNRLLAMRPLVVVGLCSYSLYLWHWPLLVLFSIQQNDRLTAEQRAAVLAVSFALALVSWRFVEMPFRRAVSSPASIRRALLAGPLALLGCVALGAGAMVLPPWGLKAPRQVAAVEAALAKLEPLRRRCLALGATLPAAEACSFGAMSAIDAPSIVVWGDSHAHSLVNGIAQLAAERGLAGRELTRVSCPPLMGGGIEGDPRCGRFNVAVVKLLGTTPSIHTVVLAARWGLYAESKRSDTSRPVRLIDTMFGHMAGKGPREVLAAALERTVAWLRVRGVEVILFADVPEFASNPAVCVAYELRRGGSTGRCALPRATALAQLASTEAIFGDILRRHPDVHVVWPADALCDDSECSVMKDEVVLYRDDDHLSADGALYLSRWAEKAMENAFR